MMIKGSLLMSAPVVSRTGRTEYQLLPMKASDRGRKFETSSFWVIILVVF